MTQRPDDDQLPDDPEALRTLVRQLNDEVVAKDAALKEKDVALEEKNASLEEKDAALEAKDVILERTRAFVSWLQRQVFGRSSEKVTLPDIEEALVSLGDLYGYETGDSSDELPPAPEPGADESEEDPAETGDVEQDSPAPKPPEWSVVKRYRRKRKGHGRKKLPEGLPQVEVEHEVPEDQRCCPGCDEPMIRIGQVRKKLLEYLPVVFFVLIHVRAKYACKKKGCEGRTAPVTAPLPELPIHKGKAGASLLAHVLTSKFSDHLPLYRQQKMFRRSGVDLAESTLGSWVAQCAKRLEPLAEAIRDRVLESRILHTDDTIVPVQDIRVPGEPRGPPRSVRKGRLWVHIGDRRNPYIFYLYTPTRHATPAREILASFRGYIQADAYGGYDKLFETDGVEEVACWAHARRKFFDLLEIDAVRAKVALAFIKELYKIEARGRELEPAARRTLRQAEATPILKRLGAWVETELERVSPQSAIRLALTYVHNQWDALNRYLEDGELEIDNSAAERAMRGIAVGRKNWLFAGSDESACNIATILSVIRTAERQGVDPHAYLKSVLTELPNLPREEPARCEFLAALLPDHWRVAVKEEEEAAEREAAILQQRFASSARPAK